MITRIRKQLFTLRHLYSNPVDAQRAQVLLIVNVAIAVLSLLTTLFLFLPDMISSGTIDWGGITSSIVAIAAAVISHRFIQSGRLKFAIWIILAAIILGTLSAIFSGVDGLPNISATIIIFLPVPIVTAGVLLNRRGLIGATAFMLVVITAAALAQQSNHTPVTIIPAQTAIGDLLLIVMGIGIILAILMAFLGTLQRIANESFQLASQR